MRVSQVGSLSEKKYIQFGSMFGRLCLRAGEVLENKSFGICHYFTFRRAAGIWFSFILFIYFLFEGFKLMDLFINILTS